MSEARLRGAIVTELRSAGAKVIVLHIGPFSSSGEPDLIGCWHGYAFALEVKLPTGKATPIQNLKLDQWRKAGARTGVVRSVQEAVRVVIGQG